MYMLCTNLSLLPYTIFCETICIGIIHSMIRLLHLYMRFIEHVLNSKVFLHHPWMALNKINFEGRINYTTHCIWKLEPTIQRWLHISSLDMDRHTQRTRCLRPTWRQHSKSNRISFSLLNLRYIRKDFIQLRFRQYHVLEM